MASDNYFPGETVDASCVIAINVPSRNYEVHVGRIARLLDSRGLKVKALTAEGIIELADDIRAQQETP